MYITILVFYISLLGIIAMILIKRSEIKKGNDSIESKLGRALEHSLSVTYERIQYFFKMLNRRTFVAFVQYAIYHVLYGVRKVYVELKHRALMNPHGKRMIDAVRGRGEIKNHGASFYLRRISDK